MKLKIEDEEKEMNIGSSSKGPNLTSLELFYRYAGQAHFELGQYEEAL